MDETKLLNYLKGESDAEECLEVEAWYYASAEHKKQLDQLYYMLFVGERKVAMDGVDTENSLSVLKDRIKHKESEKKSVHRIRVSKWKRYAMPLAAFLCGLLVSVGALYWISSGKSAGYIFATESGQRAQAVLPDGTKVWLNASTQIVYKPSFWKRERQVDLRVVRLILRYHVIRQNPLLLIVMMSGLACSVQNSMSGHVRPKKRW